MAVYERTYQPYTGPTTPQRSRFLILPRYAYEEIFKSKAFLAFFVACFVWPAILALMIYASYSASFLKFLAQQSGSAVDAGTLFVVFDAKFFLRFFTIPQFWLSFLLTFIIGPALISADMRNNALPLYLSRPFSRVDYILGKISVLIILLSLVTWVPGLFLFCLHSYMAGGSWMLDNLDIALAIFLSSAVTIVLLSLISLALSAYVKWKPLARLGMFGVFLVAGGLGTMINVMLRTDWGSLINIGQCLAVVSASLYGVKPWFGVPIWTAWLSVLASCVFFLGVLAHKIKAFEVVR